MNFFCKKWRTGVINANFSHFQTSEYANFELDAKNDTLAIESEIWLSTYLKTRQKRMIDSW